MIQRYPILEYLYKASGCYKELDGNFEVEIRKNGYDFLLLTNGSSNRSQIYGVIGVAGENLELHASVGLPNIITFSWPFALEETEDEVSVEFTEQDVSMGISLVFSEKILTFMLKMGSELKAKYVLQKA